MFKQGDVIKFNIDINLYLYSVVTWVDANICYVQHHWSNNESRSDLIHIEDISYWKLYTEVFSE